MRYEDQQFQSDDEKNLQKQRQGPTRHADNRIRDSKLSNHKCKTIDIEVGAQGNKGPHSKSMSLYANRSASKVQIKNRKKTAVLGKEGRLVQSLNFKQVSRPMVGSINNPALIRRQQSLSYGSNRNLSKQYKSNKTNSRINFKAIARNKKLELASTGKSQCMKVSEYFSHSRSELGELSTDEISRLTNKIKEWIKRLDMSLSEKINKAIREGETAELQQSRPEKMIEVIKACIANNKDIIATIQSEHAKLQDQEGSFKEEQYEFMLDKEILRLRLSLKQQNQNLISLGKQARLDENKINETQYSAKYQKRLDFLKTNILQGRRDYAKSITAIERTQAKLEQIQRLLSEASNRYDELAELSKTMSVNIASGSMQAKYQQLKHKRQKVKLSIGSYERYVSRSLSNARNEIKNMEKEARQYQEDTKHNEQMISFIAEQTERSRLKLGMKKANLYKCNSDPLEKGYGSSPFIKAKGGAQTSKNQLNVIRQTNEINLQEAEQYHNQFLNVQNQPPL